MKKYIFSFDGLYVTDLIDRSCEVGVRYSSDREKAKRFGECEVQKWSILSVMKKEKVDSWLVYYTGYDNATYYVNQHKCAGTTDKEQAYRFGSAEEAAAIIPRIIGGDFIRRDFNLVKD